jgi:hypothetical protein
MLSRRTRVEPAPAVPFPVSTPEPTATPNPADKRRSREEFYGRLAVYLAGVAIGFLLLGFFKARGRAEAQRREAEQKAMWGNDPSSSPTETSAPPAPPQGIQGSIPNEKR